MADSCTPRSSSFSIANILSDDVKGVLKKRRKEDETNRREPEQDKKATLSPFSDGGRTPFFPPYHTYYPALIGRLDGRDSHYPITASDPRIFVRQIPATSSPTQRNDDVTCKTKVTTNFESERNDFAKDYSERITSDCESDDGTDANVSLSVPGNNNDSNVTKVKKKTRTVFSRHQIFYLESAFDTKRYLSSTERAEIASALNLTETQVKVWFQNRRNKWKSQVSGSDNGIPTERYPGMLLGSQYPLSVAASQSALQFYRRPMFYF